MFELLHHIHGGHDRSLRETVRVRLTAGDDVWESEAGGHVTIPGERHALAALEDSVVLLTLVEPVP